MLNQSRRCPGSDNSYSFIASFTPELQDESQQKVIHQMISKGHTKIDRDQKSEFQGQDLLPCIKESKWFA